MPSSPRKIPSKIKFLRKMPEGSPLFYLVDRGNPSQTGDKFGLFVDWMIENLGCTKIPKLTIFLKRPLDSEEEALAWCKLWEGENKEHLDKLESKLKEKRVSCQLTNWSKVTQTEAYRKLEQAVDELFHNDTGFQEIVKHVAEGHKYRTTLGVEEAANYLRQKSAAVLSLGDGVITYPASQPDPLEDYASRKLECGPSFIGYAVVTLGSCRCDSKEVLQNSADKFLYALERAAYEPEAKLNFFVKAVKISERSKNYSSFEQELARHQGSYPDFQFREISFHGKKTPIGPLIYAISKDNSNQTGDCFESFVHWVIAQGNKVQPIIILSDFLHRYYVGEEKAWEWGKKWENDNKQHLEKLRQAGVQYELMYWDKVLEAKTFPAGKSAIDVRYYEDEKFSEIVQELAKKHQHKVLLDDDDAAIKYLLEESAAIFSWGKKAMTYPETELNPAVDYVLKHLEGGPDFYGHMLNLVNLYRLAFNFCCALKQSGHKTQESKRAFFEAAMAERERENSAKNNPHAALKATLKEKLGDERKLYSAVSPKQLTFFKEETEKETIAPAYADIQVPSPHPSHS